MSKPVFVYTIYIASTPEKVFRALTDTDVTAKFWFGNAVTSDWKVGAPVEFHAYAEAYHDFDWPNLKRKELTSYTTAKGVVPITGEDPEAHADAIRRVEAFFARHFSN